MRTLKFQDFLLRHPIFDQLVPIIAITAWWAVLGGQVPGSEAAQVAAFVGLSAVAGIVLAAATFVCTMLYQSASPSVRTLRSHFKKDLVKNWTSIFVFVFIAALLPIGATLLRGANAQVAFCLILYSAGILLGRSFRTYLWLIVSFRLESAPEPPERSTSQTRLKHQPK